MATRKRKYKAKAITRKRGPVMWRKDPNKLMDAYAAVVFCKEPVTLLPEASKQIFRDERAWRASYSNKLTADETRKATDAKYQPLVVALKKLGVDLSLDRNFNAGRRDSIARAMRQSGVKPWATIADPDKAVNAFIRWLKLRKT